MKRKSFLMLAMLLSAMFTVTSIPVQAGFSGSETTSAIYLDFESKDELSVIDGQIASGYYSLGNEGYGDSAGSLLLQPAKCTNMTGMTNGVTTSNFALQDGQTYRLTWKVKATANATVTPMFFLGDTEGSFIQTGTYPVDTSSKVTKDEATGVYSFTGLSVWSTLTGNIVTGDGTWQTYTCDFTMKDGAFTAGSSSTLAIDDYAKMKILLRSTSEDANAKIYLDDVSLMQSAAEYGQVDLTYRPGTELMDESARKITSKYNSSVLNSITYKIVNSGVASDVTDGRYHLSAAGKTGDGAYAAVGKSSGYVRYQTSGYDLSKVEGNQFYRFTARLKAPAVTVDDTLDTDGLFYIDSKTGAVSAKTDAVVNNYIGTVPYFKIITATDTVYGAFSGYLDENGNYVPFLYDATKANNGKATLTADWIDFVGYFIIPATDTITWKTSTGIEILPSGAAGNGVMFVDEMSVKAYTSDNLVPNGDMELSAIANYNSNTIDNTPLVFASARAQATTGNTTRITSVVNGNKRAFIYAENGANAVTSAPVRVEAGKNYKLRIGIYTGNKNSVANLDVNLKKGESVQQITTGEEAQLTTSLKYYDLYFKADDAIATTGDVAPTLNVTVMDIAEETPVKPSHYFDCIELTEIPGAFTENVSLSGTLATGAKATVSWKAMPANVTEGVSRLVKASQTDGEKTALIGTYEAEGSSLSFSIPASAYGKKLQVEVISYVNDLAESVTTYTTEKTVSRGNLLTYDAKTGAVYASSADDNAVLVYATYTSNGIELVDCEIVYITNGVYEADALPNNLETGDSTKVMLWKDMISCAPLTPEVKD